MNVRPPREWKVRVRPKNKDAERKLNLAWRTCQPRPIGDPVVATLVNERSGKRVDVMKAFETVIAAFLCDDVKDLPKSFQMRVQRWRSAGLWLVREATSGIGPLRSREREWLPTKTGLRVMAVGYSLPDSMVVRAWRSALKAVGLGRGD